MQQGGEHLVQRYVMAVVGFFVLILSGCFGANPLLTTMEPPPTFESARSELRAISAAANSLLVSDVVVSLSGSDRAGWRRAPTSCGRRGMSRHLIRLPVSPDQTGR